MDLNDGEGVRFGWIHLTHKSNQQLLLESKRVSLHREMVASSANTGLSASVVFEMKE
jgi:hypothetical protein